MGDKCVNCFATKYPWISRQGRISLEMTAAPAGTLIAPCETQRQRPPKLCLDSSPTETMKDLIMSLLL